MGLNTAQARVLIVEDEISIAKMIAMNLKVAGYEVTMFHHGGEAAEAVRQEHNYDIALLDVMLPGVDGFALLDVIRPYNIPVIFLTAKDDIGSKVQGLQGGAEDYIVKPFEMLELMVRMEKVLERTSRLNDVICILDMEINLLEHTVRKNGEEIPLKPMEFELLCVLARNKNIAISREELLRRVWGVDYMGETRTVDVHIGQLRKKLSMAEYIKTISKVGYRLEEV